MKRILLLLVLPLVVSQVSIGQENPRILKAKKMFFAEELNLSMDEIESFWPTYEKMRSALKQIAAEKRITCKDPKKINECLNSDEKYIQTRNRYLLQIARIIDKDKAMRIPSVERDFVKSVREGMRNR